MIQSVDRMSIAEEINKHANNAAKDMPVLIEVNVAGEASKHGFKPEELIEQLDAINNLPRLEIHGLMTIAPWTSDPEKVRPVFRRLREIKEECEQILGAPMQHLSMGMSGDFEVAIQEGATIIRIGTAIFGPRPNTKKKQYNQQAISTSALGSTIFFSMSLETAPLTIANRTFESRLFLGTGKFSSNKAMNDALETSGTQIVTVALRRADLSGNNDPYANILEHIDPERYLILPNTSGAMNAQEAVRLAKLAAAAGLPKWVKLEIHPDPRYLLPDPVETYEATKILVKEGFTVMPYINADPVLAMRLQEAGAATVMPLGAPIGSNRGIKTRDQISIIVEQASVPVVVDAGIGSPSHAAEAMELGADAVLVNTAIAVSDDPSRIGLAFKAAVKAGRMAYEIGLNQQIGIASATSPLTGFLDTEPAHHQANG